MHRRELVQLAAATGVALRLPALRRPAQADWHAWRVNGERINAHLAELSQFGKNPEGGVSRIGFSDADVAGRAYVMGLMRAAGLDARIDQAGNILGERPGSERGAKPILFGSHIDSVPHGGNYDGDVGSLSAIEVAQRLAEVSYRNRHPLIVTVWCDEESGLTGSRGFLGDISAEELRAPSRDGVPLGDKIRKIGGDPDHIALARHEPGSIAAYVELHIEQGGFLDQKGLNIGIVEGIVGINHYDCVITGFANHAGTTPMDQRQNALLAASELTLAVDRVVRAEPGRQVGTVGRLIVKPNAPNVIPGEVDLTVELRDLSMEKIAMLWERIRAEAEQICPRYGAKFSWTLQHTNVAALSDPAVRRVIADATAALGLTSQTMPSGAGHDAQDLARLGPMGMIFVPSVKGVSHAPTEFTKPADVTNGANVLLQTVLRLDASA